MSMKKNEGARVYESGMTLLEVLIALAVLSIGLAGMAAMHLKTLQFTHSAYYSSLASAIALDLEERLWIDLATTTSGDGCPDVAGDGAVVTQLISDWTRTTVGGGDGAWSSADLARPNGLNVSVTEGFPPSGVKEITVQVSWTESRFDSVANNEGNRESFSYDVRVMCKPT